MDKAQDVDCTASNVPQILGITGSLTVLALLAVCLRSYVRISMLKFYGPDDWTMAAAALMCIGTFTCLVGETYHGVGSHMACVLRNPSDLSMIFKWTYFHAIWVTLGQTLVKISVAFFLLRLAPSRPWRWFLVGSIVFLACFAITCAGTLIFSCVPVNAFWDFALQPTAKCFSLKTYADIGLFNTIINILTDFLFALLPIPLIRMLKVNRRTKITLGFILGLGLIACAAGVVKAQLQLKFFGNDDRYWRDDFVMWNAIELCLGILAASLPPLKPLFSALLVTNSSEYESETLDPPARRPPTIGSTPPRRSLFRSRGVHEIPEEVEIKNIQSPPSTVNYGSHGSQSEPDSHQKIEQNAQEKDEEVAVENHSWQGNSVYCSDSEEQLNQTSDLERSQY